MEAVAVANSHNTREIFLWEILVKIMCSRKLHTQTTFSAGPYPARNQSSRSPYGPKVTWNTALESTWIGSVAFGKDTIEDKSKSITFFFLDFQISKMRRLFCLKFWKLPTKCWMLDDNKKELFHLLCVFYKSDESTKSVLHTLRHSPHTPNLSFISFN